jgi:hypothetical protein
LPPPIKIKLQVSSILQHKFNARLASPSTGAQRVTPAPTMASFLIF